MIKKVLLITMAKKQQEQQKSVIGHIFEETEFHGFSDWYKSHAVLKAVWSLILIIAIIAFVFEFYTVLAKFLAREKVSNIELVDGSVTGMPFPQIIVCPLNRIDKRRKEEVDLIIDKEWYNRTQPDQFFESAADLAQDVSGLDSLLGSTSSVWSMLGGVGTGFGGGGYGGGSEPTTEAPTEFIWTPRDVSEYYKKIGYSTEDLFVQCAFSSVPISCHQYVEEIFDRDYGKCFTISAPAQRAAGLGLSIAINLAPQVAYGQEPNIFDGIALKLGRAYDPGDYKKMMIPVGTYNLMDLSMQEVHLFEDCGGTRPFKILKTTYSAGACHMDCEQDLILSNCDCILPLDRKFLNAEKSDVDFCDSPEQRRCAFNETKHRLAELNECTSQCNVPCVSYHYKSERSAMPFPAKTYIEAVLNRDGPDPPSKMKNLALQHDNGTEEVIQVPVRDFDDPEYLEQRKAYLKFQNDVVNWQNDYIILNVAFSQLDYTIVKQQLLMTGTTMISNFGGQIGLWLGGSIISIIKIFLLIITMAVLHFTSPKTAQGELELTDSAI